MDIGVITGREIAINRDGDTPRLLLQVVFTETDVKTVELVSQHGEDVNPPTGARVVTINLSDSYEVGIAVSDNIIPEVDPGEKEIYSTDALGLLKKARVKLGDDGVVTANQGVNSAVSYAALNAALQTLVTAINATFATKLNGAGAAGGLVLDISLAESPTVKIP